MDKAVRYGIDFGVSPPSFSVTCALVAPLLTYQKVTRATFLKELLSHIGRSIMLRFVTITNSTGSVLMIGQVVEQRTI